MDLSANDIRNYEFTHQMRGYDREEVDNFLEQIATAFEALKQENLRMSMEVDSLKTQLAGLRQFEDTIKSAAIDARRNADMTIANAQKEAELILSRAKTDSEKILGSRMHKVSEIEERIAKLQVARKSYLTKLRNLIKSHLDILEETAPSESTAETKSRLEITESTEVTRKKLETIATKPTPPKAITTEEANAPEHIVEVSPEAGAATPVPAEAEVTAVDVPQQPEQVLDPELAVALVSYRRREASQTEQQKPSRLKEETVPAPGEIVETTARAEDVPDGFIARDNADTTRETTDKIPTDDDRQASPDEHRPLDMDMATEDSHKESSFAPENLADELDRVVAKFEEEMDKAAKN
jgi:cell division initiation protein